MKKGILALMAFGFFSCNQGSKNETEVSLDSIASSRPDSAVTIGDAAYFWEYFDEGSGNPALRKT
jgi:hypothetical protein